MSDWLIAVLLGFIEGLTEFIPVSSTGHLLLAKEALGLDASWDDFVVPIQLGAILAVVSLYFRRLLGVASTLHTDPQSRRFAISILIAFLPAVAVGVLFHDVIKTVLFDSPRLICVSLILGGFVLLALDRWPPAPRHFDPTRYPFATALGIGVFQCLAMIPGVSRSGATIAGALLLRSDKRAAAEFSFYLAMPTMVAAFSYDLYKTRDTLTFDQAGLIAVGFVTAFLAGLLVVRALIDFVGRRGFAPFALWRIAVGTLGLVLLGLA